MVKIQRSINFEKLVYEKTLAQQKYMARLIEANKNLEGDEHQLDFGIEELTHLREAYESLSIQVVRFWD